MKAVVLRGPGDLALLEVPEPEIHEGYALVKMTHCGICGSDIRYLKGDNPWAKQTLGEKHVNPLNIILGHEASGIVEAVGPDVTKDLIGKRVALIAFGTCGVCDYCKRGEEHLCPDTQHLGHGAGWGESQYYYGGMAEKVPIPAKWLAELPSEVSNEAASLLDPLGVAVHGTRKARVQKGDSLLVIGCGPVGVLASPVAHYLGSSFVACVDVTQSALNVALKAGADYAANAQEEGVTEGLLQANGGRKYRAILDTIGAPLSVYLPLLERGGTYVTMTVTEDVQPIQTQWLAGERAIVSSCNFQMEDYDLAMALLKEGIVKAEPTITHSFPLSQAMEAFRVAEGKDVSGAVKVVITNPG